MQRKLLRSLMERNERDITNSELASEIGVSDATISNFFLYKYDLCLSHWILAIRYLTPEKEDYLMLTIAKAEVKNENRLNCRLLMEYASSSRNLELLSYLIQSQKEAPKENKDWAEIYEIALSFQKREVPDNEILKVLRCYKPKYRETRIFSSILESRILFMMKEYKSMFRIAKDVQDDIASIKNEYIRESYMSRLSEVFAQSYLFLKADINKARFFANSVINSKYMCAKFSSHMYHLLGTSFIFEDYTKSIEYFKEYHRLLIEQGRDNLASTVINNDIAFINILWGNCTSAEETNDQLEKLHFHARCGNIKEAAAIEEKNNCTSPFALCYLGVVKKEPALLLQSLAMFVEMGNKFFAQLPKKEIRDYPAHEMSANVIYGMNIA